MSNSQNQKFSFWKVVESQIRSKPLRMNGHLLSENDAIRVANAYILWALVTQDLLSDERIASDTNLRSWLLDLSNDDVGVVLDMCKRMLTCVRHWSPIMGDQGIGSFKHYLISEGIRLGDDIFRPIWHLLYAFAESFDHFKELNTFLVFITRLTLRDVTWVEATAIDKYVTFENVIKNNIYDDDIIQQLRELYLRNSSQFSISGCYPSHGSGATSTTKRNSGIARKYEKFQHTFGTNQLRLMTGTDHPLIKVEPVSGNNVSAKIIFVPKGIDKKRVISTEPISHQYYQHLIAEGIDKMFHDEPAWGVSLHKQEYNRELAQIGSRDLTYGTVDLTDASDSVTHTLVERIMHGTLLFSLIERCRTRVGVLPTGECIVLEKYAPMGSAVCFPLECMIFSLIVQLANKRLGVNTYFRVYGDDLVVHALIFEEVLYLLNKLHFEVNRDKTFYPGSVFTESCGIECYRGVDVSPTRIPRRYDPLYYDHKIRSKSPSRVNGVVTFANTLGKAGLLKARAYLVRCLLDYYPGVPFSSNSDKGLFSSQPTNFHLKKRLNSDLQREEVYHIALTTVETPVSDDLRYQLCLEKMSRTTRTALSHPDDRLQLMVGPTHQRLKWRWDAMD